MTEQELRAKNQKAVEQFFALDDTERLALFTEDGAKVIPFNPSYLKAFAWRGKEKLRANFEFNAGDLSSWKFYDMEIIPGLDPNFFLVKTIGEGYHTRGSFYKNVYLFTFRLRDGLIEEVAEYMNPLNGMIADGFEIPDQFLWDENRPPLDGLDCEDFSKRKS